MNSKHGLNWYRMDLHLHTPASRDYQQPEISYLDILQQAERRGLDIIAFTDHNTVRGYRAMLEDVQQLEWLEQGNRITPEETYRLSEYRRLFDKMLILPGFEFTATFGFHILGVFSPDTEIRYLEHLLLDLNIPPESLDHGETTVGASADVLTAYHAIHRAGGLVIAAHANSTHGVAMRGLTFGGQTRIAYTQDSVLHALEVTDLDRRGRRTTARFFDGSKPEYSRPMRCIQGSDAHRLSREGRNGKSLGVGDRTTEISMQELSFDALYQTFDGSDLARTRPYRGSTSAPFDHVLTARQEGPSIVQAFHENMLKRGGNLHAVVTDICAFANTNGGSVYVGVSSDPKQQPSGVRNINRAVKVLAMEVERKITPQLEVKIDAVQTQSVPIIRVQVSRGEDSPYAIDDNKIYVRDDTESSLAVRDEIVQLVLRGKHLSTEPIVKDHVPVTTAPDPVPDPMPSNGGESRRRETKTGEVEPPRTGVEIVMTEKRNNVIYHSVRDLRNGNVVRNVTRKSARKLWHYAILQVEEHPVKPNAIEWQGDIALIQSYTRAGKTRYDLAQRGDGNIRIYYGVTEDGFQNNIKHSDWLKLLKFEDED